eukprot:TRINITY_DN345_c0_g1_i1.p1 TRINITY_DN345_c0_g1~~TRINITY_DN345_c0_g1_i1.p1  ORF type:complete len:454 (+),score=59.38 TRINITY_DN345_c0_g1_i1:165-1526(+)
MSEFVETEDDFYAHFYLGTKLGQGQLGMVYACHNKSTGELVGACKYISKEKIQARRVSDIVISEIAAMRSISGHKNVVGLKSVFENSEAIFLIIEICMGGDLFKHLSALDRLEEGATARMIQQILLGLKHCHHLGVVHRDIKAENILISYFAPAGPKGKAEPQIKIADFGFAALLDVDGLTSGFYGSPLYMSPEVIQRARYGTAVDVWSTGVLLYTTLSGVMPFYGSDAEVYGQILDTNHTLDLKSHPWDCINPLARDLVKRMLDPNQFTRITVDEALCHPWVERHCAASVVTRRDSLKEKLKQLKTLSSIRKLNNGVPTHHPSQVSSSSGQPILSPRGQTPAEILKECTHDNPHTKGQYVYYSPRTPFDAFLTSPTPPPSSTAASRRRSMDSYTKRNSSNVRPSGSSVDAYGSNNHTPASNAGQGIAYDKIQMFKTVSVDTKDGSRLKKLFI